MNKTRWIIFSAFTVGALALLVLVSGNSSVNVDNVDTNAIQKASTENGKIADHIFGKADSKVILMEYGDFQCPPCSNTYPILKAVSEKYKDQLQFVFRNFPISTSHPNAKAAAATAEAAGLQGKYWEMHSIIYERQNDWSDLGVEDRTKFFESLAKELGLDIKKFSTDIASEAVSAKIDYDYQIGKKAGVDGTPTVLLNGVKLDSSTYADETKLEEAIKAEFKKNNITIN